MAIFSVDTDEARPVQPSGRAGRCILFSVLAVLWLLLDQFTKAFADTAPVGTLLAGPFAGILEFRLVHNTGAAWGLFGDSTGVLAALSLTVCVFIAAYVLFIRSVNLWQTVGLSLVFAGGIGNCIDRLTNGYVVDFINTVFMSFPTFNVADIGVTCGVVIFFIGLVLQERSRGEADDAPAREGDAQ